MIDNTLTLARSTMSSREIAELTGKRHDHVLRDIDNLLKTLPPDLGAGFSITYEGDPANGYRAYLMDRDSSYCLVSGYDATARMRIIKRWQELEVQGLPQTPEARSAVADVARVAKEVAAVLRSFGVRGNALAIGADNATRRLTGHSVLEWAGMTYLLADPRGLTYTPSELGAKCDPPISAIKFNLLLESAGLQTKEFGSWLPTDAARGLFEWLDTGKRHGAGTPVKQLKWFDSVLGRVAGKTEKFVA